MRKLDTEMEPGAPPAAPDPAAELRAINAAAPGAANAYNLGVALAKAGRREEAAECYVQALAFDPRMIEARVNAGNVLRDLGRTTDARHHHLVAYARKPGHELVQAALAATLAASGWANEACQVLQRAADPRLTSATLAALAPAPERAAAVDLYQAAAIYLPDGDIPWLALGDAYLRAGELDKAWDAFDVVTALAPGLPKGWSELEAVSRKLGRPKASQAALRRLLELTPGNAQALNNLGGMLLLTRDHDEAIVHLTQALEKAPGDCMVLTNLISAYSAKGDFAKVFETATRIAESGTSNADILGKLITSKMHLFDWQGLPPLQERFLARMDEGDDTANPFSLVAIPGVTAAYQRLCAARFARTVVDDRLAAAPLPAVVRGGTLRIGYLSGEFREHATAWLVAEVIERHDRSHFEVTGFASAADAEPGPTRRRLEGTFDSFVDISGLSDDEAAAAVRAREIDILIDLNGYTGTMRPGVFARRPAPVLVNYLGYPGTLGGDLADYIIADSIVIPPELERHYAEKVLRLPHCYQPNDRKRPLPPAPSRAAAGLPESGFVFCSFNNGYKLTPDVFDIWCGLLRQVPGSVLWVLSNNAAANANLLREAADRGVEPGRLVFAGRVGQEPHMARFRCADLFLDTFPCTAHTTASDALWCGVPVVTRMGETFASRVAASVLHAAGLPQLVARDAEDYARLALRIATDPDELAALKRHLEAARQICPLFDTGSYTRDLEALYGVIARRSP